MVVGYVINLKESTDRWKRVQRCFSEAGVPLKRVDAVRGKDLRFPIKEFDERAYKYLHGRRTVPTEVGCYLSHIKAMRTFLESKESHALLLEDDAIPVEGFSAIIKRAMCFQQHWDILRLSSVNSGRKYRVFDLDSQYSLGVCFTREKGAGAYIVNRKAAEVFLKKLMPMRLAYDIAFDLEFFYSLRAMFVTPLPVRQEGFQSLVQVGIKASKYAATRYLTVLPYRAYLEASRVFFRVRYFLKVNNPRLKARG